MGADQVFSGRDARVPPGPRDVIVVGAGIYPPGTGRDELPQQFRRVSEGGRLVDMGAAGIAVRRG